jgi:hypothetical protein
MAFSRPSCLLRRGLVLEYTTLGWNVVEVVVPACSAVGACSVALACFGRDGPIEVTASLVVWELAGAGESCQRRALRLIGGAFVLLALPLLVQGAVVLIARHHAGQRIVGIGWTALVALAMFLLAEGKARTGVAA